MTVDRKLLLQLGIDTGSAEKNLKLLNDRVGSLSTKITDLRKLPLGSLRNKNEIDLLSQDLKKLTLLRNDLQKEIEDLILTRKDAVSTIKSFFVSSTNITNLDEYENIIKDYSTFLNSLQSLEKEFSNREVEFTKLYTKDLEDKLIKLKDKVGGKSPVPTYISPQSQTSAPVSSFSKQVTNLQNQSRVTNQTLSQQAKTQILINQTIQKQQQSTSDLSKLTKRVLLDKKEELKDSLKLAKINVEAANEAKKDAFRERRQLGINKALASRAYADAKFSNDSKEIARTRRELESAKAEYDRVNTIYQDTVRVSEKFRDIYVSIGKSYRAVKEELNDPRFTYTDKLTSGLTKTSQSAVLFSRELQKITKSFPDSPINKFAKGLNSLATSARSGAYITKNLHIGLMDFYEASEYGKSNLLDITTSAVKTLHKSVIDTSKSIGLGNFAEKIFGTEEQFDLFLKSTTKSVSSFVKGLVDKIKSGSFKWSDFFNFSKLKETLKNVKETTSKYFNSIFSRNKVTDNETSKTNSNLSIIQKDIKNTFSTKLLDNFKNKIVSSTQPSNTSSSLAIIQKDIKNTFSTEPLNNFKKGLFLLKGSLGINPKIISEVPKQNTSIVPYTPSAIVPYKELSLAESTLKRIKSLSIEAFSPNSLIAYGDAIKKIFSIQSFGQISKSITNIIKPENVDSTLKLLSSGVSGFKKNVENINPSIKVISGGFKEFTDGFKGLGSNLAYLGSATGIATKVLLGLTATIGVVVGSFMAVGKAIRHAFDNIKDVDMYQSFVRTMGGDAQAQEFLRVMDVASKGTISIKDTIGSVNLILTDVNENLRSSILDALPKLLQVATIQSKATGRSVEDLYNRLVTGIKKAEPELIDETGLIIKLGQANKELAKSMGKSVLELTAEEKQLAILNATINASTKIIENSASIHRSASETISAIKAQWSDFGLYVTQAFEPFVRGIAEFLEPLNRLVIAILKPIISILKIIPNLIGGLGSAFSAGFSPIVSIAEKLLNFVTKLINGIAWLIQLLVTAPLNAFFQGVRLVVEIIDSLINIVIHSLQRLIELISLPLPDFNFSGSLRSTTDMLVALVENLEERILNFIDNTLIGLGNWVGMAVGIFQLFARQAVSIIQGMTDVIGAMLIGQSPPPEGALSELDTGARNAFRSWLENFTGQSLSPLSYLTSDISSILGSIGKNLTNFTFFDYLFQGVEDRLKSLTDQYNNFKQLVDNSFELLNNKQNELIKYLNQGDQSVLSSIRAIDLQKESANELLNIRKEQFLLAENELLVLKGQAGYLASINNLQENGVISDIRSYEETGSSDRTREDSSTGGQPSENVETSRGGASGGSSESRGETPEEARARLNEINRVQRYYRGVVESNSAFDRKFTNDPTGRKELAYLTRFQRTFETVNENINSQLGFADKFSASFASGRQSILSQYQSSLYSQDPADRKFVSGQANSLEIVFKNIGKAIDEWTPKIKFVIDEFAKFILSSETLLDNFESLANYRFEFPNPFEGWKLPDFDGLFNWWGEDYGTSNPKNQNPMNNSIVPASNNIKMASPVTPRVSGQYQPLNIFESLLNSLETLIVELPVKLATINTLFTTLFEVPMQALITRLFNSTYQTSLPYAVHKSMLITIPAILDSFIINKWIIFKENLIKSFEDFESLLSKVLLRPIVNILNSILSSFNKTMRTFAEGINQFILFYNKLPISIRGGDKLEFFKLDDLVFNPIEVPQFAKGGLGSGLISVGERGQEYVMGAGGSRTAVFPNSYVKATNNLAYQLSMVNSTIRGNYNRGMTTNTSNVDRSIQANIYTNNVDLISLQQYRAIR